MQYESYKQMFVKAKKEIEEKFEITKEGIEEEYLRVLKDAPKTSDVVFLAHALVYLMKSKLTKGVEAKVDREGINDGESQIYNSFLNARIKDYINSVGGTEIDSLNLKVLKDLIKTISVENYNEYYASLAAVYVGIGRMARNTIKAKNEAILSDIYLLSSE